MTLPRAFALAFLLASGGCIVPPDLSRARDQVRAPRVASGMPPEEAEGLREFVGAVHVHSYLSPDSKGTLDELLSGARRAKLDFVALTDHFSPRIDRQPIGRQKKVLFIPGAEISHRGGSILALGLREWFSTRGLDWDGIAREIERRGALPFIGHLENYPVERGAGRFRGAGVVNLHAAIREGLEGWGSFAYALSLLGSQFGSGSSLRLLPLVRRQDAVIEAWDRLALEKPFAAFAESDAHSNLRWGPFQFDSYASIFRLVRTHLLAPACEERPILDALAAGRGFLAFDGLADATGFRVRGRAGSAIAFFGETLPLTADARLEVSVPAAGRIRLYRNGTLEAQVSGKDAVVPVTRPGVWRVEVFLLVWGTERPWIFSNPIRVAAPP
jgi:hypothetical protein